MLLASSMSCRVESAMSDLCYSFPVFNRVLTQAGLMDRMMQKTGVDPLEVIRKDQGASWYEARTRCIDCVSVQHCRAWLEAEHGDGRPIAPQFCPNSALFDSIGP